MNEPVPMPDAVIDSVFRAHTTSRRCECRDQQAPLIIDYPDWISAGLQAAREWIDLDPHKGGEPKDDRRARITVIEQIDRALATQAEPRACPVVLYDTSKAHTILRIIKWDGLNGCYYFQLAGMYVGVELDGYMHT